MPKTKGKTARGEPEGPLEGSPSHLLHRVLQVALDVYAEETGPGALTQRQFAVLTAVAANEGCTQTDLVKATGIDRSTLADMVARMIAKGLLERERSAVDARANTVRLTDQGRADLEAAAPRVAAADRRILAFLPRGKRDSFLNVLRAFARASVGAAEAVAEDEKPKKKKADREEKRPKLKAGKADRDEPKKKKKVKKAA